MTQPDAVSKLLVSEAEAAKLLGLCPRTLFALRQQGRLRFLRVGRVIRYSVADLREFIAAETARAVPHGT